MLKDCFLPLSPSLDNSLSVAPFPLSIRLKLPARGNRIYRVGICSGNRFTDFYQPLGAFHSSALYFLLIHSVLFTHLITFHSSARYFSLNQSVHFTQLLSTFTHSLNTFHNSSALYFFLFICSVLSTYPLSTSCHQIRTFHSSAKYFHSFARYFTQLIRLVFFTLPLITSTHLLTQIRTFIHAPASVLQTIALFSLFLAVIHRLNWCFTFSAK